MSTSKFLVIPSGMLGKDFQIKISLRVAFKFRTIFENATLPLRTAVFYNLNGQLR